MLLNALLLSLIYLVSRTDMINGYMMLTKPIVLGPLVGLVLGDLQAGILIGATLELAFIGVMNIGISQRSSAAGWRFCPVRTRRSR